MRDTGLTEFDILPQRSRATQKPLTLYGGPRSVDDVLGPCFNSGKDLRISGILSPRRQYAPMISSFMSKMAFYEVR